MGELTKGSADKIEKTDQSASEYASDLLSKRVPWWAEGISIAFWAFVPIKIFLVDIDRYALRLLAPSLEWILDFRFIFYLGILTLVIIFSRVFNTRRWIFYIFFYPAIVIFWKSPIYVYRKGSLDLVFLFAYAACKIIASAKKAIALTFAFLLSAAICIDAHDRKLLYIAAGTLVAIVYYMLIDKVVAAVRSSKSMERFKDQIEQLQCQAVKKIRGGPSAKDLSLVIAGDASVDLISEVESAIFYNRVLIIVAKQLRKYRSSTYVILNGAISTLGLFAFSVISYTLVYYAISVADPGSFEVSFNKNSIVFFVISFKSMIFASVDGVMIKTPSAQIVNITQNFSSLFIITIFGSMLLTTFTQRRNEQFERIIDTSEREGLKIEQALAEKYGQRSIGSFLDELRGLKRSMISFLLYLTRQIDR